ncbi:MAG: hypothetical protein AABY18_05930 [Candidatus Thermoplasmatota archaeon]|mgnify:CR=1 FL=1
MDMPLWLGIATNGVAASAYLAVAGILLINAIRTRHVWDNPLGVATVAVFLTCGGGHAVHLLQLLDVPLGRASAAGLAIQAEYANNAHMWIIDILTAVAAVAYWMLRRRFPALVSGAAVFEDLRTRERRALEINDHVVQGLARAKLALDLQQTREGEAAVADTMASARQIITELLGKDEVKVGSLRRKAHGGDPVDR